METIYLGTITRVCRSYGFIGRETVWMPITRYRSIGSSYQTRVRKPFKEDIFIHQDDCPTKIEEGQHYRFSLVPDPTRKGAFRAANLEYAGCKTLDRVANTAIGLWLLFGLGIFRTLLWINGGIQHPADFPVLLMISAIVGMILSTLLMSIAKLVFRWKFSTSELFS